MRLIQLDVGLLRAVDDALDGKLGDAIVEVVRAGGEPVLVGVRHRHDGRASSWSLSVSGAGVERLFSIEPANHLALALVVHLHVGDLVDEIRADVARHFGHVDDGLEGVLPWPRSKADQPS